MKNSIVIGLMVLGMGVAQAELPCISYQEAMSAAGSLSSHVAEEDLPELVEGWKWVKVYKPSRDPELMDWHWMSWPNGETLTICK